MSKAAPFEKHRIQNRRRSTEELLVMVVRHRLKQETACSGLIRLRLLWFGGLFPWKLPAFAAWVTAARTAIVPVWILIASCLGGAGCFQLLPFHWAKV